MASKIQKRLASIVCSFERRKQAQKQKQPIPKRLPLMEQVSESQHQLFLVAGRLLCTECKQSITVTSTGAAVAWAHTVCHKVVGNALRAEDTVHIGRQVTHHSHTSAYHRRVLFCSKCGSYTSNRHLINLAKQCGPATAHGQVCLDAFRRDKLPPGLTAWPGKMGTQNSAGPPSSGGTSLEPMFTSNARLSNIRQRILARSRL